MPVGHGKVRPVPLLYSGIRHFRIARDTNKRVGCQLHGWGVHVTIAWTSSKSDFSGILLLEL